MINSFNSFAKFNHSFTISKFVRNRIKRNYSNNIVKAKSYAPVFKKSLTEKEEFWERSGNSVHWFKKWDKVLDDSNAPFYKWYKGGKINACFNALDVHIEEGRGEEVALIHDSPFTGVHREYTYNELLSEVKRFASLLKSLGVQRGDVVVIYMPMVPEAAISMLACARIGAIHSVVFGGFAPMQLASRIEHSKPKAIIYASCGFTPKGPLPYKSFIDTALDITEHKVTHRIIFQRPEYVEPNNTDIDWNTPSTENVPAEQLDANDPLYIIYTSGTTGDPKGILRDNAGYVVSLRWSLEHIFDIHKGDIFWAASDIGWVVGHSYVVYGPLISGATAIMYEGKPVGTPDAGAFWRVIAQNRVKSFFVAPTAIRAIKKEDPYGEFIKKYDISCLKSMFVAGERCDPDTIMYLEKNLKGVPIIDNWWQTETGWPMASNFVGLENFPTKYGSVTKPVPGWDIQVLDKNNNRVPDGEHGGICVKLPLPPGALVSLYKNDERYKEAYLKAHPGYYQTGDYGYIDTDGYLHIMARNDDVINVAGIRLSTGAIEEIIAANPYVAECAVIGPDDPFKGQVPVGLLVLNDGENITDEKIIENVIQEVRTKLGAIANFNKIAIVPSLPKTRSGKILRGALKNLANGHNIELPPTIEDPETLLSCIGSLAELGYNVSEEQIIH